MPNGRSISFPSEVGLAPGASGEGVEELHKYLARFGYLRTEDPGAYAPIRRAAREPEPAPGDFDDATEQALTRYQSFHGLPATGELDEATTAQMRGVRARCRQRAVACVADRAQQWLVSVTRHSRGGPSGLRTELEAPDDLFEGPVLRSRYRAPAMSVFAGHEAAVLCASGQVLPERTG